MATLTVGSIDLDKVEVALTAAAGGGDEFANTEREIFFVKNAGSGAITLTFTGQRASNFGVTSNKALSITNDSKIYAIGPFLKDWFNDANDRVQVTYSGVTTVTVGALKLLDPVSAL